MHPVEMNKAGLLAAAMYAILEDHRLAKGRVECFSVQTQLLPASAIEATLFGTIISGYIRVGSHYRDFVIDFDFVTGSNTIKVEVTYKMECYGRDRSITRISTKHVHTLSTENVAWDWASVNGTALDIIGMILGEENS